jgi:hypothetical protein
MWKFGALIAAFLVLGFGQGAISAPAPGEAEEDQVVYDPFAHEEASDKPSRLCPTRDAGYAAVPMVGPVTLGGPPVSLDPPTPDDVLRVLKGVRKVGRAPVLHESQLNNVQMVIEPIVEYVDPQRVYPLIGPAELHHAHYKCTIYFTEVTQFGSFSTKDEREAILYIDHNHIHIVGNTNGAKGRAKNGPPARAVRAKVARKQVTRPAGNSRPADPPE